MKTTLLLVGGLLTASLAFAQKREFRFTLNSGLLHFGGERAVDHTTSLIENGAVQLGNLYGSRAVPATGFGFSVQQVGRRRFLGGASIAYERLRNNIHINSVLVNDGGQMSVYSTDDRSNAEQHSDFVNVHAFFGYRLIDRGVTVDLTAGPEAGIRTGSSWKGRISYYGHFGDQFFYTINTGGADLPAVDVRGRGNLVLSGKKLGLHIGYSYGFTRYGKVEGAPAVKTTSMRGVRFGVCWKLN